jgi:5-methyltetrahydrofolate--homocysteine methyltransferase
VAYARAAVGFWPVFATADDRLLFYEDASCRNLLLDMPLERDLLKHKDDTANVCLTDFIVQEDQSGAPDYAGLFLLTASSEALDQAVADLKEQGDVYTGLLLQSLLDVLAEACSEYLHFEYVTLPCGAKRGIRPAFGYPSCPDHTLKKPVTTLLQKEEDLGISLTSSCMMKPAASVCGMYIGHPQAFYFTIHKPGIS